MARIRTIKPEFWSDDKIASLPMLGRLLFIAMWNFADDDGRGRAIAKEINGFAFPLDEDISDRKVEASLGQLDAAGLIHLYTVNGTRYYCIPSWSRHQVVNRPAPSKLPAPPEQSVNDHGTFSEPSRNDHALEVGSRNLEVGTGEMEEESEFAPGSATPAAPPSPSTDLCLLNSPPKLSKNGHKAEPITADTWAAYRDAYVDTYHVEPVRNKTVNGQLSQLVQRLGREEAPKVASWYLSHRGRWYVQQGHSVGALLRDCEKLHTEMLAGVRIHARDAAEVDRLASDALKWERAAATVAAMKGADDALS